MGTGTIYSGRPLSAIPGAKVLPGGRKSLVKFLEGLGHIGTGHLVERRNFRHRQIRCLLPDFPGYSWAPFSALS